MSGSQLSAQKSHMSQAELDIFEESPSYRKPKQSSSAFLLGGSINLHRPQSPFSYDNNQLSNNQSNDAIEFNLGDALNDDFLVSQQQPDFV
jgi:hypothetical protein